MIKTKTALSLSLLALMTTTGFVEAAAIDKLRAHRAVYDLAMVESSDRSGITGMNGRIVYEMKGSVCEGFAVRFRFLTNVQTSRKGFTTDQRSTTYESGDGLDFNFVTQSYLNGQLEQEVRGTADRSGPSVNVKLSKPEKLDVKLDKGIFMTQHIAAIIDAAKSNETILSATVFDGSDKGDELVDTTAIVGKTKRSVSDLKGEPKEVVEAFEREESWPVSVSYFSTAESANAGERLPVYQVSFLLQESGVSRDLMMRYDDYSLRGSLKKVEFLPSKPCTP